MAKQYIGKLKKASIYLTNTGETIRDVYKKTGADLIITGHWWNDDGTPCGNYKVDGQVLSQEWNAALGMAWKAGELPQMRWSDLADTDNFLCTVPLLYKGEKQDVSVAKYKSFVCRSCARPAFGFKPDGTFVALYEPLATFGQMQDKFLALGVTDALCLDGGGSGKWMDKDGAVEDSNRWLYNYVCFWFEGTEAGPVDRLTINEPTLSWNGAFTKRTLTDEILLHHAAADGSIEAIHQYHQSVRGYVGIAYQYYVRKDGSIWRGRPEDVAGGHTEGHNFRAIGICAEGNFETEAMPDVQREALRALVTDIKNRYPDIVIKKHSDVNATACPGKNYPFDYIAGVSVEAPAAITLEGIRGFQMWLNGGYGAGLVEDGIYGPKTKAGAVRAYQATLNNAYGVGLSVDGIFGAKTKAAVRTLRSGSQGAEVVILQGLLLCNGYDCNGLDGIYGANTTAAVKKYQAAKKLAADGLAGPNTFEKLMR